MKKIIFFAALLGVISLTSCEKDEIGGTATQATAGQWYVTVDAVDESGNPIDGGEDYFGLGRFMLLTYNTAANSATEMYVDDLGTMDLATLYDYAPYPNYSIKSRVVVDQQALTFKSTDAKNEAPLNGYDSEVYNVTIDGKILKDAGKQNNGSKADSIVFYVSFTNDPWYPDDGYAKYKVSGIRYSGLVEND